jgi:hypothetical protein
MRALALSPLLLLAACASVPVEPGAACAALKQAIPAVAIDLPTGGAVVESVTLVAPSDLLVRPKVPCSPPPPEVAFAPALAVHCQVIGAIAPVDP